MTDPFEQLQSALADRYRIERELGQGGMATVFLAEDLKHHRLVAVKVFRPELSALLGPDRFLREIEIAARLQHPHILTLLDSGAAGGLLYYIMPFVEGQSLRERLDRERQLPLDDALRIARDVASALDYAHRHEVVHRDIKPENILLAEGQALVADFGIARAMVAAGGPKVTSTGAVLGTPAYMSPEQAMGSSRLDGRSDVYSLGCVLYELLAGQPPFTGATEESVVHQHLSVEARPVTALRPAVPEEIERALRRALAKSASDRFSTAGRFAEALAHHESAAMPAAPPFMSVQSPRRRTWRLALLGGASVAAMIGALLILRPRPRPAAPGKHERSEIAVLPFQNLSTEGPHAYFAGGLHDELITQLAKVAALKVISRTSVMGYSRTSKPLKQIATELGVGSVVEGSVQVAGQRLRVTVQLIDAATDEHLWAEHYDRTLDDAFAIQSEVAQRIVMAVGSALTSAEQGRLAAAPTANAEAYRLYLQGREYWTRPGYVRRNWEIAQQLYERALALDTKFALAHADLSEVHGGMYFFRYDPSAARAARQREEAEAALRLAPDLPQAHIAMGLMDYWGRRDYRSALDEYAIALKGLPNDAGLWWRIAGIHRRLGNWNEAFAAFEKATQLDPRAADVFDDLGLTYRFVHRYADAVGAYDRALSLAPDLYHAAIERGRTYLYWRGQLDTLRAVLKHVPSDADPNDVAAQRGEFLLMERNADGLLQMLQIAPIGVVEQQEGFEPSAMYAAWAHQLRGDHAATREAFDSARVRLDTALRELPDDVRVHVARGMVLAELGRRDEALSEARWVQQSVVYRGDALQGRCGAIAVNRARILAQAGNVGAGLDELERLLAGPSDLSVQVLRLDPRWDFIRNQPRFRALLAKYGQGDGR